MKKVKYVKWKDVKVGDFFPDGSQVTQIHTTHMIDCYKVYYGNFLAERSIILSKDHLLLCDISLLNEEIKKAVLFLFKDHKIPINADCHMYSNEPLDENAKKKITDYMINDGPLDESLFNKVEVKFENLNSHPAILNDKTMWLTVENIAWLVSMKQKIYCNGYAIKETYFYGNMSARCVSTSSGLYKTNDLIHHNSVTLRNIIFHCLTHSYDWGLGLVDLKLTEFTQFKDVNGVVGVANTVPEAVELLRVAREILYRRNKILADKGLQNITDYKPEKPTEKIWVSGRELHEDTELKVKINEKETTMTAKELLELVNK